MARSGAKKVYFASAPPVRFPNVYGIDMAASSEFIANKNTIEEIAERMGADKLFYQDIEDLIESVNFEPTGPQEFDTSAFNGFYVTDNVSSEYLEKIEKNKKQVIKTTQGISEEPIGIHNQG